MAGSGFSSIINGPSYRILQAKARMTDCPINNGFFNKFVNIGSNQIAESSFIAWLLLPSQEKMIRIITSMVVCVYICFS